MKKLQLIILAILISIPFYGQDSLQVNSKNNYMYAEILGTAKLLSKKVTIVIDFGQNSKLYEDTRLRDESGNVITFNSMVDAMNWMGAEGWEFVQAYIVTEGQQNVYHWLLKLNLKSLTPEQLDQAKGIFRTKKNMGK